jgi:hypothetical protein
MDNRKKTAGSKMISTTTRTAVAVIESAPKPQICGCGFGYPRIPMGMPQPNCRLPYPQGARLTTKWGTRADARCKP